MRDRTQPPPAGRILAIDFGEKRVGVAISDVERRLAVPLEVLERRSDRQVASAIAAIARREEVVSLVVGEPLGPDGARGDAAQRVRSFARKLTALLPLPVTWVDETLSSWEARERLRAAGLDPRRHPERLDAIAAQVLLEEALAREPGGAEPTALGDAG